MATFSTRVETSVRPTSTPTATPEAMPTVDLFHEWSNEPRDYTLERLVPVDQTAPPAGILVRSHVLSVSCQKVILAGLPGCSPSP